jgi:uncharacterized protein (DUF488 family)
MTASTNSPIIHSIGHSDHEPGSFVALLQRHGITTLVDVRSQPYSRWVPHFNRETLVQTLTETGLTYLFMGDTLGGRPSDDSLEAGEHPNYDRIAATPGFQAGVGQLLELARTNTVAMMCSEGDYRQCHRTLLVTPELLARGARVIHIRPDGDTVEAHPELKQLALF